MAAHSSILVWEIPWTEESGGLQFIESKKSDMTEHAVCTLCIIKVKLAKRLELDYSN